MCLMFTILDKTTSGLMFSCTFSVLSSSFINFILISSITTKSCLDLLSNVRCDRMKWWKKKWKRRCHTLEKVITVIGFNSFQVFQIGQHLVALFCIHVINLISWGTLIRSNTECCQLMFIYEPHNGKKCSNMDEMPRWGRHLIQNLSMYSSCWHQLIWVDHLLAFCKPLHHHISSFSLYRLSEQNFKMCF